MRLRAQSRAGSAAGAIVPVRPRTNPVAFTATGVKRWNEKRAGKSAPEKRPGVTVNRRDLFAIPHPSAVHLWRDLHVRDVRSVEGRQRTDNVRIDLIVEGVDEGKA